MKKNDWLIDLSKNWYVDMIENEVVILPIKEEDESK